jgi:lipoprotein-anchoring transpeptidase ErfK/SrfK
LRARPLNREILRRDLIANYQAGLERLHFSVGFLDADEGIRTTRAVKAFQESRFLAVTGKLDAATCSLLGESEQPFINYTVTEKDLATVVPTPATWRGKSQSTYLGYNDGWEMVAEKFHAAKGFLKKLNPDVASIEIGTSLIVPRVEPSAPLPKPVALRIIISETAIQAIGAQGEILAHFPCSIAKNKEKVPKEQLKVINYAPQPTYTFDPALFVNENPENLKSKLIIPPGPNNPVGTAWIGLSLPGYGIHGTPEPEHISRTRSHGCFRLSNWNAEKILKMIKIGMPVEIVP